MCVVCFCLTPSRVIWKKANTTTLCISKLIKFRRCNYLTTHLPPFHFWSNLFTLPDTKTSNHLEEQGTIEPLYLLGTDHSGPSQIKISKSLDGGVTWNVSSIIFSFNKTDDAGHHGFETGPTPTLVAGGRVYRAMERSNPKKY